MGKEGRERRLFLPQAVRILFERHIFDVRGVESRQLIGRMHKNGRIDFLRAICPGTIRARLDHGGANGERQRRVGERSSSATSFRGAVVVEERRRHDGEESDGHDGFYDRWGEEEVEGA